MDKYAIVLAGGSGLRMGSEIPKQFIVLHNKPILQHTIERIASFLPEIQIVLALPQGHISYWESLVETYACKVAHTIVPGGNTRFHSVQNALAVLKTEGIVAIHDGVRPLVSKEAWLACMEAAEVSGAAILVTELTDSIRVLDGTGSTALDRSAYRLVQTPQTFRTQLVKEAYRQAYSDKFTDDASVVESLGYSIELVTGNSENIKITRKSDLLVAADLLRE
ncbi:MAG: hypothetical protein RIS47_1419 [Bacteroidota bacterium]|jgi:2-C-methyl-D-erythritol 4-phosphate cytidylyltransferase